MASKEQVEILLKLNDEFSKELKRAFSNSEKSVKKFSKASVVLTGVMLSLGHQLTNVAKNMVRGLKDSILLSARYETMGIVVDNLGGRIGATAGELRGFEKDLQDTGISLVGSREAISRLIAAQIDLEHSTKLARIAQDGAVIANTNSTESFERLIAGITTGQVRILRTMNLFVDFKGAMKDYAKANDKTVQSLTELERIQARTNAVLDAGSQITGTYEAALNSAGKQLGSLDRDVENFRVALGSFAQDMLLEGVLSTRQFTQELTFLLEAAQFAKDDLDALGSSVFDLRSAAEQTIPSLRSLLNLWETLVERAKERLEAEEEIAALAREAAEAAGSLGLMGEKAAFARNRLESFESADELVRPLTVETQLAAAAFGDLDKNIGSTIEGMIEDMQFFAAGGAEIAVMAAAIKASFAGDKIGLTDSVRLMEALQAETLQVKVLAGLISFEEAKKQAKEWGIELDNPLADMERISTIYDHITQSRTVQIQYEISTTGTLTTGGGAVIKQHGGPFDGVALVGDPGPNAELVFGSGVVIPAGKTREIMREGIVPVKGFQGGGGFAFDADTLRQIAGSRPTKAPGTGGIFRGNVSSGIRDALASSGVVAPAATRQAIAQVVQESVETGQEAAKETIVAAVKIAAEQQTANLQPQFDRQIAAQDNTNDLLERIELVLIQQPDSEEARDIAFESKDTSGF